MLLTRSLPPQFLLPSWTAPELALAVQRSYISSTSTKRFEIRKQTHGSKELKTKFLEHRALKTPEKQIGNRRRRPGTDTRSESLGSRHFKPTPPPRPTPVSSAAFYIGKRYGVPDSTTVEPAHQPLSDTKEPEIKESGRPHPKDVEVRDHRQTIEEPGVTLGRQSVERRKRGLSLSPGTYRLTFGRGAIKQSEPIEKKVGQLTEEHDGEELNGINKHRRQYNVAQHGNGTKLWSSKPDDPSRDQAFIQQPSTPADDLAEVPELDMADRWNDPTKSNPKQRSTKRLPWESEELLSSKTPLYEASILPPAPTKSRPASSESVTTEPHLKESMSLFEELFPEERKVRHEAIRRAEERLDKLPAFEWDLDDGFDQTWKADRERKKVELHTIPQRRDLKSASTKSMYNNVPVQSQGRREDTVQNRRHEPSIVILEGLSKHLEESDFFRVGPKGEHIEGWTSGILKVIPARDHTTLEPLGYYYLLFSNDAAARAYMDNTLRLHTLGKSKGPSSIPFMPPPPGALKEGENMKELLRGFSVVPRQNKLSMRLLKKPYRAGVLDLVNESGPPAIANRRAKGDALVLFSVDVGAITYYDILYAVKADGRHRNMHWKFAGGKDIDISNITHENKSASQDASGEKAPQKWNKFKTPDKYIFAMKDMQEARRFVREWHRRPIEVVKKGQKEELGQERPAVVSAELLW